MANFPSNSPAFPGAGVDSRSVFITRTYMHLVGAFSDFILVELGLFESGLAVQICALHAGLQLVLDPRRIHADGLAGLAHRADQLLDRDAVLRLRAYVVAEALIFVPLLYMADARRPARSTARPW